MKIDEIIEIVPERFYDERGFFSETWNRRKFNEEVKNVDFVQDNISMSLKKGTLRGLHFQSQPHAQSKLVYCITGSLFDVVVDIRVGSPTYGNWFGEELSEQNGKQLFVPIGFLHGFLTLEPNTKVLYKCSNFYSPQSECSVRYNDPEIGIEWPDLNVTYCLSDKDRNAPFLNQINSPFEYKGN